MDSLSSKFTAFAAADPHMSVMSFAKAAVAHQWFT
jgi:hypothetical protein